MKAIHMMLLLLKRHPITVDSILYFILIMNHQVCDFKSKKAEQFVPLFLYYGSILTGFH